MIATRSRNPNPVNRSSRTLELIAALEHISPIQREVVLLHDLESWTHPEIAASLGSDDVSGQFVKLGFDPMSATPAQFGDYLRRDIVKWARVLKSAGIALEATP